MKIIYATKSNTAAKPEFGGEYGAGGRRGEEGVSWIEEIILAIDRFNDDPQTLVTTLTESEANERFDDGYGGTCGRPFTAWTENRVYFPISYDGSEWVGSAPRHPCNEASDHQGGG